MKQIDEAQIKAAFDEILGHAPDLGEPPLSQIAYVPNDDSPRASRAWIGIAAGMIVLAGTGGLIMAASRATPTASPTPTTQSTVVAPTTTASVPADVNVSTVTCQPGRNALNVRDMPSSEMTFSVATTEDGSVALTVELSDGETTALACMNASTVETSVAEDLSLAVVQPIADGVLLLLAVPNGSTPRALDWLDFAPGLDSASAPFALYVAVISGDTGPSKPTTAGASEQQLLRLVNEARTEGTSTVAGIAADILAD
jgi:hypothetical protein